MTKSFTQWTGQEVMEGFRALNKRQKIQIGVAAVGVAILIPFVVWPAWVTRFQIGAEVRGLEIGISSAQTQISLEPALIKAQQEFDAFIRQTRSRLLSEEEAQGITGILTNIAERSKASLLSSQPEKDLPKVPPPFDASYIPISYQLVVEGGYHALAAFISEVENYEKLFRVDEFFLMAREETPGVHVAEIRLSAFAFRE